MSTVVRSKRDADIRSSLVLLRILESATRHQNHFPPLVSLSSARTWRSGSLADRKGVPAAAANTPGAARSTCAVRTTLGQDWLGLADGRVESDQFQRCDPYWSLRVLLALLAADSADTVPLYERLS